ncbi:hypothetical protein DPSP01_001778 [Paraphaeosphaeria sporulosa]
MIGQFAHSSFLKVLLHFNSSGMARTKTLARRPKTRSSTDSRVDHLSEIFREFPGVVLVEENEFSLDRWQGAERPYYHRGSWPPTSLEDLLGSPHQLEECAVCRQESFYLCEYQKLADRTELFSSDAVTIELTQSKGYGLFSKLGIKENQVLGEYAGELVPLDLNRSDEETRYMADIPIGRANLTQRGALAAESRQPKCGIDAGRIGSIFRFMNHSCDRNVKFFSARVGMERRVLMVVTTKPIEAGEEITMNYGEGYWKANEVCHCGSENCRFSSPPAEDESWWYQGLRKSR